MAIQKLSIIIPAYNEARTIHLILDKVKSVELLNNIGKELIIVNDCSTDDTEQAIESYIAENQDISIQYFKHDHNRGKGAAIKLQVNTSLYRMLIWNMIPRSIMTC